MFAGSGSSMAATKGGGAPATPTVIPAMFTSSQAVTQKVLDSVKEALKDAKDTQNRNKGKN